MGTVRLGGGLMEPVQFDRELRRLFGPRARSEGPLAASGAGRRLLGVDLRRRLGMEGLTDAC